MGLSTGRGLHVDQNLTNVAINFRPPTTIADLIAPVVTVGKETDQYPVFSHFEAFAVEDTARSRGGEARKITRSVSSANYVVKNYALGYDLPIEDSANMDAAYRYELEAGATRHLVGKLHMDWEKRVLTLASAAAAVSTTFVPASSWVGGVSNANVGDPVAAILAAIEQQNGLTGYRPNSILIGWRAHNYLMRNYHMRGFVNGNNNGGGRVTRQAIQETFELERYVVSNMFYTTQNEALSASAPTLTSPIHDRLFIYYAPLSPSRDDPSWMYSFRWTAPGLPAPMVVERHPYDSRRKVEGIEAGYYQDEKITGASFGCAIAGVGSAQSNGI